jgi:hypothetical protein
MIAKRPPWAGPSWYDQCPMTPAEHLRVAAQLRQLTDNPKAQELALHHEALARMKHIDEQMPLTH